MSGGAGNGNVQVIQYGAGGAATTGGGATFGAGGGGGGRIPARSIVDLRRKSQQLNDSGRKASIALGRKIDALGALFGDAARDVMVRAHEDTVEHLSEAIYMLREIDGQQIDKIDELERRLEEAHAFSHRATAAYLMLVEELETRADRRKVDRPEILRRAHNVYMGREPEWIENAAEPF